MTALIGDEHVDPLQPYPALPNLIYLSLRDSSITDQGCIELSKSQLLDQLERLDLSSRGGLQIDATALLTTPLYSHMRNFESPNYSYLDTSLATKHQHLSNTKTNNAIYLNTHKIDQFWNDE